MKSLRKTLLILFSLLVFGQISFAQTQYINQLRLIGDYDELIDSNIEIYEDEGWTLVDYNLNQGAGGQYIYLLYKTGLVDDPNNAPITDFYIKSTKDKGDHPDQLAYNNRTYHRITSIVGSDSFMNSYGDLNDGAGGRYIYLYYTTDAWDYPRGITSMAFNDNSNGAVCGNGSTTPQDINEGAGGDYIYMHYGYTLMTDVVDVDDQYDFAPLNAHSDEPLYFRLSDKAVNGSVVTVSTINVGNNNTAVIDLNGKAFSRLIQSGGSGENGHVLKVTDNSTLTVFDGSIHGTGSISGGDADKGGAVYVEAGSALNIESGTIEYCKAEDGGAIYNLGTLTIDGGTIQNCTTTSGWGHGTIYNNGIMTINNGIIQNNTANYGGAIYNVNSWRVTINGGAIQNNHATLRGYDDDGIGGGIVNNGLLYINGGSIVGNTCDREGGGIWMKDEGGIFMKGNIVIKNNTKNSNKSNVYIPDGKVINLVGSFTDTTCIGVTTQTAENRITNSYNTYNSGVDPARIFFSDNGYFIKLNASNEVIQDPSISVVEAYYIDAESNEAYYSDCIPLSSVKDELGVTLNSGWYMVDADKTFNNRIDLNGNVNFILGDGYNLTVNQGVEIGSDDYSFTIYGQSGQSGYLLAYNEIGDNNCYGTITINGGMVNIHSYISAKSINLNWTDYSTNTTEKITVGGNYYGTVTLQKSFYDGTNVIPAGVVANNNDLTGKTLVPYALYDINFGTIEHGSFTASPNQAHNGTIVTLTGTPADAEHPLCSEITVTGATTGKDVTVTRVGTSNNFTFVMPYEAVNVTAKFEDKVLVDYVDLFGETKTVSATIISGASNLTLSNGWYAVSNDISSSTSSLKNITVNGNNVNLILCDYRTLDLNDETDSYVTFADDNYQLIVWGQSGGSGLLRVANTYDIIPVGHATRSCRIVVNGGRVETYDSTGNIGGTNAVIILRGGKIAASGYAGTVRFKRFYTDPEGHNYSGEKTSGFDVLNNKLLTPCDKVFVKEGDWNVASNWLNNYMPGSSNDYVTLRKEVTIPNDCLAQMKDIMVSIGSGITIEDGGQLYIAADHSLDLQITVEKNISAADGAAQTNWYLLSSPVYNNLFTSPYNYYAAYTNTIKNLTENAYDMFRYDEPDHKWQNKKAHGAAGFQVMERGRGFLYRNAADQTIAYTGIISYGYLNNKNYLLSYTDITGDYAALKGFNLIGNPYTHNIKKGNAADASISNTYLETGFYKLSNNGQWAACTDDETIIGVGEAVLVQATSEANRQCTAFSDVLPSAGKNRDNNDKIMFTVANSQYSDVTYALFEEGHGLTKIDHRNAEVPMLYIPKNGENLAIATMSDNTKVFPLNFKAMTMGNYTIRCQAEGNFNYIHLFDKLTGEDVDLLLEKEYSFIGAPSDRDDRFVVSLEYYDNSEFSDTFAYQNGTDVIVSGTGTLQVFDVMGRVVAEQRVNGVQSITMPQGVYIFRLEGKTQKIVVR
jgi:hypothetical protein